MGQVTRIRGKVFDNETKEPLPFVNVTLVGTSIGTTSGFDGEFFIETRSTAGYLAATFIGYQAFQYEIKPGTYQEVEFFLIPETIEIQEIVVNPGENPAHRILRGIVENKKKNNPDRFEQYQYEVYNKMELDINNLTEEYKNKKAFNQFQFIFDYVDTSAITGKTFLPVFITETISDYYFQKKPLKKKEVIKASKISGMDTDEITDFTGQMYLEFNIYNNFIPIMGLDMVSPIANFGLRYYKYYLIDSAYRSDSWCYNISFKPKRKHEPTFTGNFWVHDTTFALESYKIKLAENVNINFVDEFVSEQYYTRLNDSTWFPHKQDLFIDYELTNKEYGFFARKTTSFKNIDINPNLDDNFFSNQLIQETVLLENASDLSNNVWDTIRHENLTIKEQDIYGMVDSIQQMPMYNSIIDIINTVFTGYWIKGPIEIGPYYTMFSYNPIEGARFKFGMRTSNAFSTKLMLSGHLAYGTLDQRFKYGVGALYMLNKNPRRSVGVNYLRDYEQLGTSSYAFLSDNILSSILAREVNDKLTEIHEISAFYEHEWFQGFSNTISFSDKIVFSSPAVPFVYIDDNSDTLVYNSLGTTEIKLKTRFAYNEKFLMGEFDRISLGSDFPILTVSVAAGLQGIFDGEYDYYKLNLSIEHRIPISPIGDFKYFIETGKIYGDVPYPFLQLHEGNQTFAFDDYAFNLMNYYEFVSTAHVSLMLEHHFNGLFLNHVPLFRKLKWREIAAFKILAGDLKQRTTNYIAFPDNLNDLNGPYMEAGVGVENIFKFFRVDAIWRLSYLDKPDVLPFGVFVKMQMLF